MEKLIFKILVVEDQKEIRDLIAKYLEKEGYDVVVASQGFEALEIFENQDIHLILLDVMMPGIDGFEVLTQVRKISEVPVIMLTAKQEEIDRLKGFNLGVDDYVVKPFSMKDLARKVRDAMESKQVCPHMMRTTRAWTMHGSPWIQLCNIFRYCLTTSTVCATKNNRLDPFYQTETAEELITRLS